MELTSATPQEEFLSLAELPGLLLIKSSNPKIPGVPVYPAEEINAALTVLIDTDRPFSTDIPKTLPALCKHICTYHQILLFSLPTRIHKEGAGTYRNLRGGKCIAEGKEQQQQQPLTLFTVNPVGDIYPWEKLYKF